MSKLMKTTIKVKLVRISRKDHLKQLQNEINITPKWRIFKRASLIRIYGALSAKYNIKEK